MSPMKHILSNLIGREVLDSRGNPTLEVEATLSSGAFGRAIVPSGASKGHREALELRDTESKRYGGKGVQKAVALVSETLLAALKEFSFSHIKEIDSRMLALDPSPQKTKLGGNTLLGVSMAVAQAAAVNAKEPLFLLLNEWMGLTKNQLCLPVPLMNILNGGVHADNGLEIQEFMIVPRGFSRFADALRAGAEVFQTLKKDLSSKGLSTAVGDEGGFAPRLKNNEEALELISSAVTKAGYRLGEDFFLALDVAASSFYENGNYRWGSKSISKDELLAVYAEWVKKYPIISIEDGLQEEDWDGWKKMTVQLGDKVQLVGDDLFVTQSRWLKKGIDEKIANAILVKVNQVGTLSETFDAMELARKNGYRSVVSHRSGETEDVTISHLAVGSGCGQIKTGSLSRGERTAKYNELLRIEQMTNVANLKYGA